MDGNLDLSYSRKATSASSKQAGHQLRSKQTGNVIDAESGIRAGEDITLSFLALGVLTSVGSSRETGSRPL